MTPYEIYFKEQNKIQSEDKIKEQVNNLIHLKQPYFLSVLTMSNDIFNYYIK